MTTHFTTGIFSQRDELSQRERWWEFKMSWKRNRKVKKVERGREKQGRRTNYRELQCKHFLSIAHLSLLGLHTQTHTAWGIFPWKFFEDLLAPRKWTYSQTQAHTHTHTQVHTHTDCKTLWTYKQGHVPEMSVCSCFQFDWQTSFLGIRFFKKRKRWKTDSKKQCWKIDDEEKVGVIHFRIQF